MFIFLSTILFVLESTSITIANLTFYGGGVQANHIADSVIENNKFLYSSYSMRALGELHRAPGALNIRDAYPRTDYVTNNKVSGNTFKYTDGYALQLQYQTGPDLIEVSLFKIRVLHVTHIL